MYWVTAHMDAFEVLVRCPALLALDNLRSAVSHPDR